MAISIAELAVLLENLVRASKVLQYYPPGHPQILATLGTALGDLQGAVESEKELSFGIKEDGVYVGAHQVLAFDRNTGPVGRNLFELGIGELTLLSGIETSELAAFLEYVAQDPRRFSQKGTARSLQQKRWPHIRILEREFSAGDGEALVQAVAAELEERDLEKIARCMVAWWVGGSNQLSIGELVRILAAANRAGSFGALISMADEEYVLPVEDLPAVLEHVWIVLEETNRDFGSCERSLVQELLTVGPKRLLKVLQQDTSGDLQCLLRRVDGISLGKLVGEQIIHHVADAADWLEFVHEIGRTRSERKEILYGCLDYLQEFPDAADLLGVVEAAMQESSREANAVLALLHGSFRDVPSLPDSRVERHQMGPAIQRAVELAERIGTSRAATYRWACTELEHLLADSSEEGVHTLLRGIAHTLGPGENGIQIISTAAEQTIPRFLESLSRNQRVGFFSDLAVVEKRWKELATQLLDTDERAKANKWRDEMEAAGIDVREMLLDVLRREHPELITRSARVIARIGTPEDRNMLFPLLHHGNHTVRIEMIRLLGDLAPEELAEMIPDVVEDPNPLVVEELLGRAEALPGVVSVFLRHARKGWLRSIDDDRAIAVLRVVSRIGTDSEKAEIASLVRPQSFSGKVASARVRDAARRLLEPRNQGNHSGIEE